MRARWKKLLTVVLAAILAVAFSDAVLARHKKHHTEHRTRTGASGDHGIKRDYDGTPIIMQGYRPRRAEPTQPEHQADRPVHIPRGSSTYIPPPVPSPNAGNSPPPASALAPAPQPYKPPPINSFGDRVIDAIHSYPLEKGIGNNPTDQQMYIRQRAN